MQSYYLENAGYVNGQCRQVMEIYSKFFSLKSKSTTAKIYYHNESTGKKKTKPQHCLVSNLIIATLLL